MLFTQEAKAVGSRIGGQPGLHREVLISKSKTTVINTNKPKLNQTTTTKKASS